MTQHSKFFDEEMAHRAKYIAKLAAMRADSILVTKALDEIGLLAGGQRDNGTMRHYDAVSAYHACDYDEHIAVSFEESKYSDYEAEQCHRDFCTVLRDYGYRPVKGKDPKHHDNTHTFYFHRCRPDGKPCDDAVEIRAHYRVARNEYDGQHCRYVQVGVKEAPVMEVRCGEPEEDELRWRELNEASK